MPLADNGGPTLTHALLNDSLALDSASLSPPLGITDDQRGAPFSRREGVKVDMGAFELPGGAPSASLYPRVIAVLVSGSASLHADFSIPGWASDSDLGGSGEQLRTVPVGGADSITVWFDRPVDVPEDSAALTGHSSNPATTYGHTSFLVDPSGRWATWTFAEFPADMMEFSLEGDSLNAVTDPTSGFRLDGDWSNPEYVYDAPSGTISSFPSGDGTEGGDFTVYNSVVADYAAANNLNVDMVWAVGDIDQDGDIDFDEIELFVAILQGDGDTLMPDNLRWYACGAQNYSTGITGQNLE